MRNFDFIYQTLKQIDEIEKQNFIIYPFGEIGSISKSILNVCFGIQEKFIIDDHMCENNLGIKDTNFLKTLDCNQYQVIFACNNESIYNELYQNLKCYFDSSHILELFPHDHKIVGRHSYGPICNQAGNISIGNFCSFAEGSAVVGNHDVYISSHEFVSYPNKIGWLNHPGYVPGIEVAKPRKIKETYIGNDVWIGRNALIIAGCKIGNGVIIGAGAVVTKDIPDYAVVVGVPAKIVKYRYTQEQIYKMLKIAWWNWTDEKICEVYDDFYLDVEKFIEKYYSNNSGG